MAISSVADFVPGFRPDIFPRNFDVLSQWDFKVLEYLHPRPTGQTCVRVFPTELKMADPVFLDPCVEGGKSFFSLVGRNQREEPRRRMPGQRTSVETKSKFLHHEDRAGTLQGIMSE
jgi:hypothetical protein